MKKPLSPRSAKTVDALIGKRIREIRAEKGLSQADLGQAVGVSFQQIQKYERATNRISASTLFAICQFLDYPIEKMFADPAPAPKRPTKR
ncbi:helix-turn-helix domain-containing protein [Tardiphaga sp.]|uniref:helix-turn-helix domain-containing protein n=1 Tax=Tardiphaga sp. TaxID=1926292 RepID=UPI003529E90C